MTVAWSTRIMWIKPASFAALCVAALLNAAAPAAAQEPTASHLAAARELVSATGAGAGIDDIFPALLENVRRQGVTRPEIAKDLDEVIAAVRPELDRQKEQAFGLAARAYAKWLSEAEIRDTLTFFKSPAGLKYVKVLPDLTEDLVQAVTAWSQLAGEYVITRIRTEMLKRGHQLQ